MYYNLKFSNFIVQLWKEVLNLTIQNLIFNLILWIVYQSKGYVIEKFLNANKTSEKRLKVAIWVTDEQQMSNRWATDERLMSDWWATDEQLMSDWWATDEQLMSDWWATDEQLMSNWWATDEQLMSD